jgi:carbon starvation protein CstA
MITPECQQGRRRGLPTADRSRSLGDVVMMEMEKEMVMVMMMMMVLVIVMVMVIMMVMVVALVLPSLLYIRPW